MAKYDDYDWSELPADAKKAAETLGYDKKMWDSDKEPKICDNYWKDLTAAQQSAAAVLGYNETSWNDESDSDSD
eukprot:CAMPEP_0116031480 /NCGR_PEP_ID=MMETSP0321-20121206/17536_1 /TAXON_ID=163516 /ORGANISM="Leptocylindrus danicus var. danicus, Strain B650" /LENGTH=73 /DNA_ID=CAMNT_0003506607 /DNA_START=87 /DNA_END=308 /DNA_ORIENTATION=+